MVLTVAPSLDPPEMNTSQLLLVSSLGLGVNLFGMFAMGGHHHHVCIPVPRSLEPPDLHFRDIHTRTAATVMDMGMGILMHLLHPSSLERIARLPATMTMTTTDMDTRMITTIIVTPILTTRIPIHTHTHIPLLLRLRHLLRRDIFMYHPLIIIPILNSLHLLTLILPSIPLQMGNIPIHILTRTHIKQRQMG